MSQPNGERNPGCSAGIGEGELTISVCMGGMAIQGCNQSEVCVPASVPEDSVGIVVRDPRDPSRIHALVEVRRTQFESASLIHGLPGIS